MLTSHTLRRPFLRAPLLCLVLSSTPLLAQVAEDKPPTAQARVQPQPQALLASARLQYEQAMERTRQRALTAWADDLELKGSTKQDRRIAFRTTGEWPTTKLRDDLQLVYLRERTTLADAYEQCLDALLIADESLATVLRAEMDHWTTTEDRLPWTTVPDGLLAKLGTPSIAEASTSTESPATKLQAEPIELPIDLPASYRLELKGQAAADQPLILEVPTATGPRRLTVVVTNGTFHSMVTVSADSLVATDLGLVRGEAPESVLVAGQTSAEPKAALPKPRVLGSQVQLTHLQWKSAPRCEPAALPTKPEGSPGKPAAAKPEGGGKKKDPGAAKAKRNSAPAEAARGAWTIEGNELVAGPGEAELVFGDLQWTDYDLTLEAMATDDGNGFQVWVQRKATGEHVAFGAGAQNNRTHRLVRNPKKELSRIVSGTIDRNRWYRVKIQVRKGEVTVFLDGREVVRGTNDMWQNGRIALFSQGSQPHFRNLKVTSPDGKQVLWDGLPSRID